MPSPYPRDQGRDKDVENVSPGVKRRSDPKGASEGEQYADLRREVGRLLCEPEAAVELDRDVLGQRVLDLADDLLLVLLALEREHHAPVGGEPLDVLDAVLAELEFTFSGRVHHRHLARERAPGGALEEDEPRRELPLLGADQLLVLLEGEDRLEKSDGVGQVLVLLQPTPAKIDLGIAQAVLPQAPGHVG